jgi:uncharacterized damage-inducible protein DinB
MFSTIDDFLEQLEVESEATKKIFSVLTDENMNQEVAPGFRTAARMAWHIVQTIPEMAGRVGLDVQGPGETEPVPGRAEDIREAYTLAVGLLAEQISKKWKDHDLDKVDDMYGQEWPRRKSLYVLLNHETHHRAQMTVVLRQAGARVPGVYGPAKEEWSAHNMPEPEI